MLFKANSLQTNIIHINTHINTLTIIRASAVNQHMKHDYINSGHGQLLLNYTKM